jgi:hypothetical protein
MRNLTVKIKSRPFCTTFLACMLCAVSVVAGTPQQGPDKPAVPPNPTQLFCMRDCRDKQLAIGRPSEACLYVPAMNMVRDLDGNVWSCIYGPNTTDPYQSDGGGDSSGPACQDPYQSGC